MPITAARTGRSGRRRRARTGRSRTRASWPAIRIPIVAIALIRGCANVIEKTTSRPTAHRATSTAERARRRRAAGALPRARRIETASTSWPAVANASASTTPTRPPKRPSTPPGPSPRARRATPARRGGRHAETDASLWRGANTPLRRLRPTGVCRRELEMNERSRHLLLLLQRCANGLTAATLCGAASAAVAPRRAVRHIRLCISPRIPKSCVCTRQDHARAIRHDYGRFQPKYRCAINSATGNRRRRLGPRLTSGGVR